MQVPDHPIIQNCERSGYPDGKEPQAPHCPFCGEACTTVYIGFYNEIVGCENCIGTADAWEADECFPERN